MVLFFLFHERVQQEPISVHRVFFWPHPDIYLIKSFARCGKEKTLAIDLVVEGENRSSIAENAAASHPSDLSSSFSRLLSSSDDVVDVEKTTNPVLTGAQMNSLSLTDTFSTVPIPISIRFHWPMGVDAKSKQF